MTRIATIYEPIREDLAAVEETLGSVARADAPWLTEMLATVLFAGGKRMRPAIALLAGKFRDYQRERSVPLATSLELLHTASLVHDDIIDSAGTRRGRPTASSLFDNHAAVVLGDYIFAQAAVLVAQTGNTEVTRLFAETMIVMAEAELAEDRTAFDYHQSIDNYLRRIKGKTASLFATAAQGGALVANASRDQADALQSYGENLGMAFQIVDDILDFSGDEQEMGKPVGSDLMQGTLTLPSLLLLESRPNDNPVEALFRERNSPDLLAQAITMVRESDILERAYQRARDFGDKACTALSILPATAARTSLEEITGYVLERRT
jgi:geranylgeranyl pyrophosphate synthase